MAKLPERIHGTLNQIEEAVLSHHDQSRRPHMGASILGNKCERRIWLSFRWALTKHFEARILRLFQRGHDEEHRMIKWLRQAHILVWDKDADGKQFGFRDGHLGGSADGIVARLPEAPHTVHLLEMKTHNDKQFAKLTKENNVEAAHPAHYDQMSIYMEKLDLNAGLYMAVNKNDDTLYLERVKRDKPRAKLLLERGASLAVETRLPAPLSKDSSWWECKMCDFHPLCHQGHPVEQHCRTCTHVEPTPSGSWVCTLTNDALTQTEQERGCESFNAIEIQ